MARLETLLRRQPRHCQKAQGEPNPLTRVQVCLGTRLTHSGIPDSMVVSIHSTLVCFRYRTIGNRRRSSLRSRLHDYVSRYWSNVRWWAHKDHSGQLRSTTNVVG